MPAKSQTYNMTVLMTKDELMSYCIRAECHLKMILDDMASTFSLRELELRSALVRQSAHHFEEADKLIDSASKASEDLLNIFQRRRLDDEWIVTDEERQRISAVFRIAEVIQISLSRRENMAAIRQAKEELSNKASFGIV